MNAPPVRTIAGFAKAFAQTGKGNGLTKEELLTFFRTYSANIPDPEFYGQTLTKQKLFHYCLERLHIEDQYRALIDLCCVPPETKNPLPSQKEVARLLDALHQGGVANGVRARAVTLSSWSLRRDWLKTLGRIERNPDAAITSARTMLEGVCKEIIVSQDSNDPTLSEGDLGKLLKRVRDLLGLSGAEDLMVTGLGTMTQAIAERSNTSGDRHARKTEHSLSSRKPGYSRMLRSW